ELRAGSRSGGAIVRSAAEAGRQAGVFGDRADLPVGVWLLHAAWPAGARPRARHTRGGAGEYEQAHNLGVLLHAARVLPRLRARLRALGLPGAQLISAAALPDRAV